MNARFALLPYRRDPLVEAQAYDSRRQRSLKDMLPDKVELPALELGGTLPAGPLSFFKTLERAYTPEKDPPLVLERSFVRRDTEHGARLFNFRTVARTPGRRQIFVHPGQIIQVFHPQPDETGTIYIGQLQRLLELASQQPEIFDDDRRRILLDQALVAGDRYPELVELSYINHDDTTLYRAISYMVGQRYPGEVGFQVIPPRHQELSRAALGPYYPVALERLAGQITQINQGEVGFDATPCRAIPIPTGGEVLYTPASHYAIAELIDNLPLTDIEAYGIVDLAECNLDADAGDLIDDYLILDACTVLYDRFARLLNVEEHWEESTALMQREQLFPMRSYREQLLRRVRQIMRDCLIHYFDHLAKSNQRPTELPTSQLKLKLIKTVTDEALFTIETALEQTLHAVHFDLTRLSLIPPTLARTTTIPPRIYAHGWDVDF